MSLKSFSISGYEKGMQKDKKPFLVFDSSFPELTNAYVWRDRVKKREGIKLVGRLRRVFTNEPMGNSIASPWTINTIYSTLTTPIVPEANAEIEPGDVIITIQAASDIVFTDQGDGELTSPTAGNSGTINYLTGVVVLTHTAGAGAATIISFNYFPSLPIMANSNIEQAAINNESSIIFDTKYAYTYDGNNFSEFGSTAPTTWDGTDSDFFWTTNYRGSVASSRLFFATNFVVNAANPIRYHDGGTWVDFAPFINDTHKMYQAKLIVSYYGRLLAFNTWENTDAAGYATASNFYNRCRFSQIGDPTNQTNNHTTGSWLENVFGKGGFIDAPVNEAITSAKFFRNTLIVTFERSTWELRYSGEYGLPFKWERISSDFGSESTFSTVLFDDGVLAIGDKAIIASSGSNVERIDLEIPDTVFAFNNISDGKKRIQSARDFKKEVVYWCYSDGGIESKFPNRVLLYNYRNNTFAILRDNVTAFGTLQTPQGDSWDSAIEWDSETSWDTTYPEQFPAIISGNQNGYIHWYQFPTDYESDSDSNVSLIENESLSITNIVRSATAAIRVTAIDHNLESGEVIYVTNLLFADTVTGLPITTDLNDRFYQVLKVTDDDLDLYWYDYSASAYVLASEDHLKFTPAVGTGTYIGGGAITLLPKMEIRTKDFNPFQGDSREFAVSYIDFMLDASPRSAISAYLLLNSAWGSRENIEISNTEIDTSLTPFGRISAVTLANPCNVTSKDHGILTDAKVGIADILGTTELNGNFYTVTFIDKDNFTIDVDSTAFTAYISGGSWSKVDSNIYIPGSNYAWHRFYSPGHGQYIAIYISYDDELMNNPNTHKQLFEMNAMNVWGRPAGRIMQ